MLYIPIWSDHAYRRKIKHGITEKEIADTWIFGVATRTKRKNDECWKLIGPRITLILGDKDFVIITMYISSYSDKYYERCAKWNKESGNIQGITFITDELYNSEDSYVLKEA